MRRTSIATWVAAALALAAAAPAAGARPTAAPEQPATAQPPHLLGTPTCGPSIAPADQPTTASTPPPGAPSYFAKDFPVIQDSRLKLPIGGFGGVRRGAPLHHTPVIFVHGNQADAQNWLSTMLQFQNDAGYTMQEMYALSYNGLGNAGSGTPVTDPPTTPDQDYFNQNTAALTNGGHGAADDDEVPDLCRFIEAVQWYTGSRQVDLVTHSLGVTIARELLRLYPTLAPDVVAFVGIAGGNHGTTVCRGLETTWYGCNEIAPGTAWLAQLNGPNGDRETYGPTKWMTVYDGVEGDPLFVGPDATSPQLKGADNRTFPGAYHNDLRVNPSEVDTYLPFVLAKGQAGPYADKRGAVTARQILATNPDGRTGNLCGVPKLTGPVTGCKALTGSGSTTTTSAHNPNRSTRTSPAAARGLAATGSGARLPLLAFGVTLAALYAVRRRRQATHA
jgi:pimeloyl-ACP methyl ester carboxylesterase